MIAFARVVHCLFSLVPLRGKSQSVNGKGMPDEYSGLESGELAWILGRQLGKNGLDGNGRPLASESAHGLGMGYGVDRMQRLAYTAWIEAFFMQRFGGEVIVLNTLSITNEFAASSSHQIRSYQGVLAGASVLDSGDVPHLVNRAFIPGKQKRDSNNNLLEYEYYTTKGSIANNAYTEGRRTVATPRGANGGLATGIFVMEEGPFLRGKIVEDMPVQMVAPELKKDGNGKEITHTVPRNLGDEVAFEALYAKMREKGMFDWSPDGMVLSKLESPSGEPLSSAELDARQAQLFNLAIQGPAIAKTWTGEAQLQAMPMDKVFICIVADVQSVVDDQTSREPTVGFNAVEALVNAKKGNDQQNIKDAQDALNSVIEDGTKAIENGTKEIGKYANGVLEESKASIPAGMTAGTWGTAGDAAFTGINMETWRDLAEKLRRGEKKATNSVMCNFRLMRATSSFLAQYSRPKVDSQKLDPKSRLGLKMGLSVDGQKNVATAGYIVGAWCIGTVIDNSASRSTVGHLVRIAPASMAININVNIEWWSGDKLYRHYMDTDQASPTSGASTVQARNETASKEAQLYRSAGADVPLADMSEAVAWAWD